MSWRRKVALTRDELAELVDALAELRDTTGRPPGRLEEKLQALIHDGDRQVAERTKTC